MDRSELGREGRSYIGRWWLEVDRTEIYLSQKRKTKSWLCAGMLLVPAHILLSVCGDTETDSDTAISKVIATLRGGNLGAKIKYAFMPNNQWGPVNLQEKKDWQIYCEETYLYQWLPKCIRRKLRSRPSSQNGCPSP